MGRGIVAANRGYSGGRGAQALEDFVAQHAAAQHQDVRLTAHKHIQERDRPNGDWGLGFESRPPAK